MNEEDLEVLITLDDPNFQNPWLPDEAIK